VGRYSRGAQIGDKQRQAVREQRLQQISERNKAARREKTRKFAKRGMIILGALFFMVVLIDRQFVRYDQNNVVEPYRTTINEYFDDNPLRKSKLFFNGQDLSNYITSRHPEVQEFTMSSSLIFDDKFIIETKQAAFVWQSRTQSYLGDFEGVVYATTDGVDASGLPLLKDQTALEPSLGDKVAPSSSLRYVKAIEEELAAGSLKPEFFSIPVAAREVHLDIAGKPYYVKFSLDRSVVGQISELQKAIGYIDKNNVPVRDYIDIRTEDKAYYR